MTTWLNISCAVVDPLKMQVYSIAVYILHGTLLLLQHIINKIIFILEECTFSKTVTVLAENLLCFVYFPV